MMSGTSVKQRATAELMISGIHCWDCAARLELALACFPGVETARVDAISGAATLTFGEEPVELDHILYALRCEEYEIDLVSFRGGDT